MSDAETTTDGRAKLRSWGILMLAVGVMPSWNTTVISESGRRQTTTKAFRIGLPFSPNFEYRSVQAASHAQPGSRPPDEPAPKPEDHWFIRLASLSFVSLVIGIVLLTRWIVEIRSEARRKGKTIEASRPDL